MLVFVYRKITQQLASIDWIGTESLTADRAGIFARPYAFALSVCHYRPEANFLGWHTESLQILATP